MVVLTFVNKGYVFKVPITGSNQGDNWWGNLMTLAICVGANAMSYWYQKKKVDRKPLFEHIGIHAQPYDPEQLRSRTRVANKGDIGDIDEACGLVPPALFVDIRLFKSVGF